MNCFFARGSIKRARAARRLYGEWEALELFQTSPPLILRECGFLMRRWALGSGAVGLDTGLVLINYVTSHESVTFGFELDWRRERWAVVSITRDGMIQPHNAQCLVRRGYFRFTIYWRLCPIVIYLSFSFLHLLIN